MKYDVINLSNSKVGEIELSDSIFSVEVRKDLMARVIKWQLAKARSGNHKTKTRGDVSHTTRKPFKQKGTGRARQGMTSVPHMRGGGIAFGPVVRDHSHSLNKKIRVLGLKSALASKIEKGNFLVIDNLELETHKTGNLVEKLEKLGLKSVLFVDSLNINDKFKNATSNIVKVDVLPQIGLNVYDILAHDKLVLTVDAVKKLEERLNGSK